MQTVQPNSVLGGLVRLIIEPSGPFGGATGASWDLNVGFLLNQGSEGTVLPCEAPPPFLRSQLLPLLH